MNNVMSDRDLKKAILKLAKAIDNLSVLWQKTAAETDQVYEQVPTLTEEVRKLLADDENGRPDDGPTVDDASTATQQRVRIPLFRNVGPSTGSPQFPISQQRVGVPDGRDDALFWGRSGRVALRPMPADYLVFPQVTQGF